MELLSVDRFTIEMTITVFAKQVLPESTVEWVSLLLSDMHIICDLGVVLNQACAKEES